MICGRKSQRWYRQHKQHFWWAFVSEIWRVYFTKHCLTVMKAQMELTGKIIRQLFILTYCCYRIIASKAQILQFGFWNRSLNLLEQMRVPSVRSTNTLCMLLQRGQSESLLHFCCSTTPIWHPIDIVSEYLLLPHIYGSCYNAIFNSLLLPHWIQDTHVEVALNSPYTCSNCKHANAK